MLSSLYGFICTDCKVIVLHGCETRYIAPCTFARVAFLSMLSAYRSSQSAPVCTLVLACNLSRHGENPRDDDQKLVDTVYHYSEDTDR